MIHKIVRVPIDDDKDQLQTLKRIAQHMKGHRKLWNGYLDSACFHLMKEDYRWREKDTDDVWDELVKKGSLDQDEVDKYHTPNERAMGLLRQLDKFDVQDFHDLFCHSFGGHVGETYGYYRVINQPNNNTFFL